MKKVLLAAVLAATGFALTADESAALAPSFVWKPLAGLTWRTTGAAKIENGVLTVDLDRVDEAYAQAEIDLSGYDGKAFELAAVVETKGVADAPKSYLGYRFAVNYLDMSMGGNRSWPGGPHVVGDFGPAESVFIDRTDKVRRKAFIQIGLCHARGHVKCDLSTLRIREPQPLVPRRNAGYKVKYPDRVRNLPRLRGAMLGGMGGDAWDELQRWGANLVRYQFAVRGTGPATNFTAYAEGFRKNLVRELDNIMATLDKAKAHGMKVVIDAHYACGGTCSPSLGDPLVQNGDWRIFHDRRYADLFLWSWERIAERCKGRHADIYGYDLMNEACHKAQALPDGDIVGLQARIAKAIRAIDPETTIIVESMYCDPGWFRSLSAIDLDNVIYQVHLYYPHDYTHQGILTPASDVYCWPDAKKGWNRDFLMRSLKPVIDFQKEHDAKMFVGEFSAIAWAANAEGYLRDCISIFEELGWDWTYHAFREFSGWSVEQEATGRGMKGATYRPSKDNARMRVLKQGLAGEIVPGKPAFDFKPRAYRRLMISGNSITRHGKAPKIGWTNDWGMAASAPERDYVHRLRQGLACYAGTEPEYRQIHMPLENGADEATIGKRCDDYLAWKPDLVIFAHGENGHALTNDANWAICRRSYRQAAKAFVDAGATVVLRAPFWPHPRYANMLREVAQETGAVFVDIGDIGARKEMQAIGLFWHGGVAMHPGDAGMQAIADRLLQAIYANDGK